MSIDSYEASARFVVREIKGGMTRDTDESGTDGFWDLAGMIASEQFPNDDIKKEEWQEELYNIFWAIHEETNKVTPNHKLVINSTFNASANCEGCDWHFVATGEHSPDEIRETFNRSH